MQDIKDHNAEIEIVDMPETIFANQSSLIQIFQNLIGNAIKFRSENNPRVQINLEENEGFFKFNVIDNGVGMDEAYQNKAFQPFQRLNNQDRPGTGMGLAICRKIAILHGGDIWYESKVGDGTNFHFTISKQIMSKRKEILIAAEPGN